MKPLLTLLFASTLLAGAALPAPPARPPKGQWLLDFADAQCLATRVYGTDGDPLTLAVKPAPAGNSVQLTILFRSTGQGPQAESKPSSLQIGDGPVMRLTAISVAARASGLRTIRLALPADALAAMRNADSLAISVAPEFDQRLMLGQMPALMTAIDQCMAELRRDWNGDAAAQAKLRTRASGNLGDYLSDADFPDLAGRRADAGRVDFALLVDESGRIADCTMAGSTKVPALDAQACALFVEQARFKPATGADGKPARDILLDRIRWTRR